MIGVFTLNQLAERCSAQKLERDISFHSVSTDSRKIQDGDLFVAIRGQRFDGHDFIAAVAAAGACAAIVESRQTDHFPQLVVDNSIAALGELAILNRERFNGKVIGITGSSGKTTVKEMLSSILCIQGEVLATCGNLNNHIGVPLTLLQIDGEHQFAVIEMGASAMGEIAYLGRLARPHVSVVNNVGTAHVGGFGSVANIAKGKGEIYQCLTEQGIAVINLDDIYSIEWMAQNKNRQHLTFSAQKEADVMATDILPNHWLQFSFRLHYQKQSISISLPLIGQHNVANALAAATCALALGIDFLSIKQGLESMQAVAGRMQIKKGIAGSCVIDDTYNANPASVQAAIDVLASMAGKKIMVLGNMAELGDLSASLHTGIGTYAKQKGIDMLLATGEATQDCVNSFGGGAEWFQEKSVLTTACIEEAGREAVFLVKGSRSAMMETVVEKLTC